MTNSINAQKLIDIFFEAEKAVTSKKEILNNLNVYPVPDGDTGTNMSLTLKEIVKNIKKDKKYTIGELSEIIEESSLMGGRGNSGVILSQFLSGFCEVIREKKSIGRKILTKAFENGTKEAYESVSEPVEGTILTVMTSTKDSFRKHQDLPDLIKTLYATIRDSQDTLKKTPQMLAKLKEAGVVDAGGAGFVYFLEGFYKALGGDQKDSFSATDDYASPKLARIWEENFGVFGTGGLRGIVDFNLRVVKFTLKNTWWLIGKFFSVLKMGWNFLSLKKAWRLVKRLASQLKLQNIKSTNFSIFKLLQAWQKPPEENYCMEAIVSNSKTDLDEIKKNINKLGKSAIVARKGKVTKIHFHVINRQKAEKYIKSLGKVEKFKLDDLHEQHQKFLTRKMEVKKQSSDSEVIAVVNGAGFKQIYESFEGVCTIDGGETMNPSVADFSKAIEECESENVIILPNNKNVFMAAKSACKKSNKNCKVIETYDQVQALTALLNFNEESKIDQNLEMMKSSLDLIKTFLVTRSTRTTTISGVKVSKGDFISLNQKKLIAKDKSLQKVIENALKKELNSSQLITLYSGKNVKKEEANSLKNKIMSKFKREVQVNSGGQPNYHYIVAIE
jgi:dihydroxyacetone kinase-like predicted kinase